MRRRKETWMDMVLEFPWWVTVIVSIAVFLSLKFGIPTLEFTNPFFKGIPKASPVFAPYAAGFLLLLAAKSAYESWRRGDLLESQKNIVSLKSLSWREFEELIGEIFRKKGYSVTDFGGRGADGGVDLQLKKNGELIYVQCKQWRSEQVGVKVARELYGVMMAEGATGGIIISSGTFTQEAADFVKGKPLEIVDGTSLMAMVREVKNEPVTVHQRAGSTLCPVCGSPMLLRTAKKGVNAGKDFWGCSQYPKCRGTREVEA
jgi:restriction system protein